VLHIILISLGFEYGVCIIGGGKRLGFFQTDDFSFAQVSMEYSYLSRLRRENSYTGLFSLRLVLPGILYAVVLQGYSFVFCSRLDLAFPQECRGELAYSGKWTMQLGSRFTVLVFGIVKGFPK